MEINRNLTNQTDALAADTRFLILAPVGRDSSLVARILQDARITTHVCRDGSELCQEISKGAGGLLVAEEALTGPLLRELSDLLARQPAWSDCPLVVMTLSGSRTTTSTLTLRALEQLRNVTFLERPVRVMTLVSTARLALAARTRQYQVRDLLEREQAASRVKDEFLATLSHELRTPLNVILGFSEILAIENPSSPEFKEAIEAINRNAKAQSDLISDLLDVSRIVTGKVSLTFGPVHLGQILTAATASLKFAGRAKGLEIRSEIGQGPLLLTGDATRLQQIIWNLVSNAIKFSKPGGVITVKLSRQGESLVLSVADRGQGISPEFLPNVFEKFRQQDGSITRQHGGLGLGLAIVKHLVELHGGAIEARSDGKDQGATFIVRLPAPHASVETGLFHKNYIGPTTLEGLTSQAGSDSPVVLIVDDQADNRRLLACFLKRLGARVIESESAAGADQILRATSVDAMICDISMPVEDGHQFIKRLRASQPRASAYLPAAALSACATEADKAASLAVGFDYHLTKPIRVEELSSTLLALLRKGRQLSAESTRDGNPPHLH